MPVELTPYRIEVPEADLRDLRDRLARTRWPEAATVIDWSQGMPLSYTREICRYWAEDYDWRATETRLNALPQFRALIDVVDAASQPRRPAMALDSLRNYDMRLTSAGMCA